MKFSGKHRLAQKGRRFGMKVSGKHRVATRMRLAEEAHGLLGDGTTPLHRFAQAYLAMSAEANYRPAAPGDGCGNISLTLDELSDPRRLAMEAVKHAKHFEAEEDSGRFRVGCSNYCTNRALVWVVEAARSLCGGQDDLALKLLQMAVKEIRAESVLLRRPI
jgi:hypothetical protein